MKSKSKSRLLPLLKNSFAFFLLLLLAGQAHAFPDLVRHGYASCTACHVSPTGGGITTAYGRSLSKELLSHWGAEGEERWLYAVTPPDWLDLGGDVRGVQTYVNTPTFTQQQAFYMQSDVEAAVNYKKFYAAGTAGAQGGPEGTPDRGHFISRRHYLGYHPTDESSVRVGRFYPAYGLNIPNHTVYTRKQLRFDEDNETDNVEASYSGEKADLFVTAILGRVDDYVDDWQRGAGVSTSYFFYDRFKVGVSYMHTKTSDTSYDLAGVYGILGFTKKLYMLSEIDSQWSHDLTGSGTSPQGIYSYQQLNYEFSQGFHVYLVEQLAYADLTDVSTRTDSWGVGTQLFPRPHFDFELEYAKERNLQIFTSYYDTGWLMLHFYL
jgi:hypothetical protein